MWNVECGMWNVECWNVEREMVRRCLSMRTRISRDSRSPTDQREVMTIVDPLTEGKNLTRLGYFFEHESPESYE